MTRREQLLGEIERVPDQYVDEVYDFVRFLAARIARDSLETAVASESALAKDWLRSEEDEAWQDL